MGGRALLLLKKSKSLPIPANGLKFWGHSQDILASGSDVTQINDLSGNNNHVTRLIGSVFAQLIANELNSYPAIEFSLSDDLVYRSDVKIGNSDEVSFIGVYKTISGSYRPLGIGSIRADSNNFNIIQANDNSLRFDNGSILGSLSFPSNTYFVRSTVYKQDVSAIDQYNDSNNINVTGATPDINDGSVVLNAGSGAIACKYIEMIAYNRIISSQELNQILAYLYSKYNITP